MMTNPTHQARYEAQSKIDDALRTQLVKDLREDGADRKAIYAAYNRQHATQSLTREEILAIRG